MTGAAARLTAAGLVLPAVSAPLAAYVPAVRVGDLVFSAGQLPLVDGVLQATGRVGSDVSVDEGAECARIAALNGLAAVASVAGGLDAIERVVRLTVFVAADADFAQHPEVANGASALMETVFGPAGRHARSAVGVASLPRNAPVEVELVVALDAGARPGNPG